MPEIKNKAGNVVDFSYDDDVAELFLETVTDQPIRSVLFGTDVAYDVDAENLDLGGYEIIKIMKRIVNFAFTITLCRWKQLYDDTANWPWKEDAAYFRNSRFTKIFQSAIANEDITIDLQIFALIELWVSLKDAPSFVRDQLAMIFDNGFSGSGDTIGLTLQAARDAIKNASFKRDKTLGIYTKDYCNELCYRLLYSFLIFRVAKLTYPEDNRIDDDCDFSLTYPLFDREIVLYPNKFYANGKLIVTYEQLLRMKGTQKTYPPVYVSLYLLSEISAFGGTSQLAYRSFDGESETRVEVKDEIPRFNMETSGKELNEMRKFLSFNYKNIRELAIVISDSIKDVPAVRNELFSVCEAKYPKIIADIKGYDAPNIYWDNIIMLMLVEMGFSDFLELILREEQTFLAVMRNVEWRVGRSIAHDYLESYRSRVAELEKDCGNNRTSFEAARLDMRVRTVLRAMKFDQEENWKLNPFEESLSFKYENIRLGIEMLSSRDIGEVKEGVEVLKKIYKNIFLFLQLFYVGLDSYADKRIQLNEQRHPDNETEEEKRRRIMGERRDCFDAFSDAAQKVYDKIKGQSLSMVFDGFCELCKKYNSFSGAGSFNISPEAKRLKFLITRNYICDVNKLCYFATVRSSDGKQTTIFEVLEHFFEYYGDPSLQEWLTYFYDVFFFLIYNEDYQERGLYKGVDGGDLEDKDCDPIYPYIVTYYKENIDRDNLKKCTYRVPMPIGGNKESRQGFVVTLLTEENYPPNSYFCIPLRYGSSDSWWINPFLIPKGVIRRLKTDEENPKES